MTGAHTRTRPWQTHASVLAGYTAVAIAFSWPLILHLSTHLTGSIGSDAGVYVWNQWVFRHELVDHGRFPYFTDAILAPAGGTNLSLHNYTLFQNLLALPLIGWLGVVTTFNVINLAMVVLTAYATFLLARRITGRVAESWIAGLLFAWSPLLVTRGTVHFSLVAAAPLPLFLLVLAHADGHERPRDAVALGVIVCLAATTDVYYAVYCLMIGAVFMVARVLSIHRSPLAGRAKAALWGLDAMLLSVGGLVVALLLTDGWDFTIAGRQARVHSLYTPVLVFTVLAVIRVVWQYRPSFTITQGADIWRAVRLVATTGAVAVALLSPVLYAAALRLTRDAFESPRIFWRSSPPGIDLLALILPNPNHPFAPPAASEWLAGLPNGYAENVASVPLTAIVLMAVAYASGWRPSRWWLGVAATFGLLALGPFIHVGGVSTYIPGPWALLRYVPVAGLARTPARFSVVLMLAIAVLCAMALVWLTRRYPRRRRVLLAGIAAVLLFELLPTPLTLYSAEVPKLYRHVAAAPVDTRLLELPFGLRDGTTSVGDFTARSQFYQTYHAKSLIGGYLSRLAWGRLSEVQRHPVLHPLVLLSEGRAVPPAIERRGIDAGPYFVKTERIRYVIVDTQRASDHLRSFAIEAFDLEHVETEGPLELYQPRRQ